MDIILGLVPQDGQKICNSPPANPCAGRAGQERKLVKPTQESNTQDKPSPSVLGTHTFFLSQQVDSNESHQSFNKIYRSASSSTPSNNLSQLPFKPRQKLSKRALTPRQQQCHPSTFPPTMLLLYIAPSSKKLRGCWLFCRAASTTQHPCTFF